MHDYRRKGKPLRIVRAIKQIELILPRNVQVRCSRYFRNFASHFFLFLFTYENPYMLVTIFLLLLAFTSACCCCCICPLWFILQVKFFPGQSENGPNLNRPMQRRRRWRQRLLCLSGFYHYVVTYTNKRDKMTKKSILLSYLYPSCF